MPYTLNNWTALTRYCDDGDLSIDNNATQRSLRGFAVGRNNWTFFGSDNGGKTAAVLRSFVTSCELVKIDSFAWFKDVLGRIADPPIQRLDELLPHRWAQTDPAITPKLAESSPESLTYPTMSPSRLIRQRGSSDAYEQKTLTG